MKKFTIIDVIRYPSIRFKVILLAVIYVSADILLYSLNLLLAQFKMSVFINGLMVQSAMIVPSLIGIPIVKRVSRRKIGLFS